MKKNTKIALGVVGIALVGYYIWHKNKASKLVAPAPAAPSPSPSPAKTRLAWGDVPFGSSLIEQIKKMNDGETYYATMSNGMPMTFKFKKSDNTLIADGKLGLPIVVQFSEVRRLYDTKGILVFGEEHDFKSGI